jgi:hypothetical protein
MKKTVLVGLLLGIVAMCFAQTIETLDAAVNASVGYVSNLLPAGTRVALLKIDAPTEALSRYVTNEFSARLVNGRKFSVIERNPAILGGVQAEAGYQASGAVSDETAVSLCKQLGAQSVITGAVTQDGGAYRFNIKIVNVETVQVLGQRLATLQKEPFLEGLLVTPQAAAQASAPSVKPNWIGAPLAYGRAKYEKSTPDGVSAWYYDRGISNKTTSEQTSDTRARQSVQARVAENIASDFKMRFEVTENSLFKTSEPEDVQRLIETTISNSIKTRVPRYELLETWTETGNQAGTVWYLTYVLVRFPRKDIVGVVESIKPEQVAEAVIRAGIKAGTISPDAVNDSAAKSDLVKELEAARDYALEGIRDGLNGK